MQQSIFKTNQNKPRILILKGYSLYLDRKAGYCVSKTWKAKQEKIVLRCIFKKAGQNRPNFDFIYSVYVEASLRNWLVYKLTS